MRTVAVHLSALTLLNLKISVGSKGRMIDILATSRRKFWLGEGCDFLSQLSALSLSQQQLLSRHVAVPTEFTKLTAETGVLSVLASSTHPQLPAMSPVTSPVIILTGGSRGLGLAVLRILLERYNARVTTISRNITPELEAVIRENSGRVSAIQGDVGDIATNERIMKETVDNWGGVDGLILNAGSVEPLGELELPPDPRIYRS